MINLTYKLANKIKFYYAVASLSFKELQSFRYHYPPDCFADDPVSNRRPPDFSSVSPVIFRRTLSVCSAPFSKRSAKVRAFFIVAKFIFELSSFSFETEAFQKPAANPFFKNYSLVSAAECKDSSLNVTSQTFFQNFFRNFLPNCLKTNYLKNMPAQKRSAKVAAFYQRAKLIF